ncbi:response regulator [candidate division WOR-3 bacterium]|nr:response regulator [candidate division WOR-3 bacterium]
MKGFPFSEKNKRVMVVDDEQDIANIVGEKLSESGFDITTEWDPRIAIKKLSETSYDLVITDLKMPHLDGFQLMGWIRDYSPLTKVAMITAYGSPYAHKTAVQKGAVFYIEKPFDLDDLAKKVEEILKPPREFEAKIESISSFDLIQIIALTGGKRRVSVSSSDKTGEMYIKNGKLVYAHAEGKFMKEAFNRMIFWDSGVFNVLSWLEPPEEGEYLDVNLLLLEATKILDEKKEGINPLDDLEPEPIQEQNNRDKNCYENIKKSPDIEVYARLDKNWKMIESNNEAVIQNTVKVAFFLNEWGDRAQKSLCLGSLEEIVLHVSGRELWIRICYRENHIFLLTQNKSHKNTPGYNNGIDC